MRAVFVLMLLFTVARADEVDEARQHFQEGLRFYDESRWAEAVMEFQAAKKLHPRPQLDYNIARAQDRLGDWAHAIESYQRFIEAEPFEKDAALVRARIEELKLKLQPGAPERGAVRIDSSPAAEVRLDDERAAAIGTTPQTVEMSVGAHVVFLRAPGYLPISKGFSVKKNETVQLQLSLLPEPKETTRKSRAWIAGPALGAVGLVAMVAVIVLSSLSDGFSHEIGAATTHNVPPVVGK